MPRIKTHTKTVTTAQFDDFEVELYHAPYDGYGESIFAERVGDKLVVAYLVHDADSFACNPMENGDCNGNLYTRPNHYGGGVITDNMSELRYALKLNNYDGPDIDREFKLDGANTTLRDLAADQVVELVAKDDDLASRWSDYLEQKIEEGDPIVVDRIQLYKDCVDVNGCFSEEVEKLAVELYVKHWEAIVGPYVVPVHYHSERGSTSIGTTDWDGDPDDLPDGVWVADDGAIENISSGITDQAAIRKVAVDYAEAILSEYGKWCDGDVYGCVTETFSLTNPREEGDTSDEPDEWESDADHDSCWGFIGFDYALETLKTEFFEAVIERLKQPATV